MADDNDEGSTAKYVTVSTAAAAAWLRLHGEHLIGRRLTERGTILYRFAKSDAILERITSWENKTDDGPRLAKFARFVIQELNKRETMRRKYGNPDIRAAYPQTPEGFIDESED